MRKNKPVKNLIGISFWDLTVIEQLGLDKRNQRLWLCQCKCGRKVVHTTSRINSMCVKTCGCGQFGKSFFKHGLSKTVEYITWLGMKSRCSDPNGEFWYLYGGKGVSVCERWLDSKDGFMNFLSDMGKRPSPKHSLDRIDSDKNYSPDNCRWATPPIQTRNTSRNVWIEYNGIRKVKKDWVNFLNIDESSLNNKLKKNSFEEIIDFYSKKRNIDYKALIAASN